MTRRIILASTSPRRRELIQAFGLPVHFMSSGADETLPDGIAPHEAVKELALRKAEAVKDDAAAQGMDGIIVGSDTIVVLDGDILGKPLDETDALGMLRRLQGSVHEVYTGVACVDMNDAKTIVQYNKTKVRMKSLNDKQMRNYIASGEPMDKAGAYGIQGLGAVLIDSIEGCYFNVVGLPLSLLSDMLAEFGVEVL